MEIKIRPNVPVYMQGLKKWLYETRNTPLEDMAAFFRMRLDGYEEHMAVWKPAYERFSQILKGQCGERLTAHGARILDLGCGTGLELEEIWKQVPELSVVGVDLCMEMLVRLQDKYPHKSLTTVCQDYFTFPYEEGMWDAVISFESLHHFPADEKAGLYRKIHQSLKADAVFLLGDYIACCEEEEQLLWQVYQEKKDIFGKKTGIFHFDIPLTLEHEVNLMHLAGFSQVDVMDSINGAVILSARK